MKDEETKDKSRDVFISYASDKGDSHASRDRQAADRVCEAMENQGIRCWAAHRDILPGDDWLDSIIAAVEKSKVLVLVFSANANNSKWVKDEVTMALDENIKIIPFRIEDVSPRGGLKILKYRCQWLDAFTSPLEEHIGKLVNVICRHLGKELAISPQSTESNEDNVHRQPEAPKEEMPEDVKKIAEKIGVQKVIINDKGFWEADYGNKIIMVYIPEGEFKMGQTEEEKQWLIDQFGEEDWDYYEVEFTDELPSCDVYLDGYWMGKYEVTFDQYDKYCEATGKNRPDDESWGRGDRPVINVSWEDANAYCKWLSEKKGLNFKLPTEAQWEKAARGSDGLKYPWGKNEPDETLANFEKKVGKTSAVGSYPQGASPYGLLDMAGNVYEWCWDWYEADYFVLSEKNPTGPEFGAGRVMRGGRWDSNLWHLRCANRSSSWSFYSCKYVGFRLCQDNQETLE